MQAKNGRRASGLLDTYVPTKQVVRHVVLRRDQGPKANNVVETRSSHRDRQAGGVAGETRLTDTKPYVCAGYLRAPVLVLVHSKGAARCIRGRTFTDQCANSVITSPASRPPVRRPSAPLTCSPLTHTPCTPSASVCRRGAPPGRSKTRRLTPRPTVAGSNSNRSAA